MKERLTFGGHATTVLEIGGRRLVTDPLLRKHVGLVLRAHHGLRVDELGALDGVLISHLHHDHLDLASLKLIGRDVPMICPTGAEALLEAHGFTTVEPLRPGERTTIGGVEIHAAPAVHDGHRALSRAFAEPIGYVIDGASRVYFAGDTGLFDGMERIGADLDLALLPIWGWGPTVGDGHLDPESAARAVRLISPRLVVPIHWGSLAPIGSRLLWPRMLEEPARRFAAAAAREAAQVTVRVLQPGESLELEGAAR